MRTVRAGDHGGAADGPGRAGRLGLLPLRQQERHLHQEERPGGRAGARDRRLPVPNHHHGRVPGHRDRLLERWIRDEFGSIEAQYGRQTKSLADGEKMLNELVEMRLRGLIDDALFSAKRRQLEEEVGGLRLAVGRTQERLDRVRATVHAALDFRQRARAQFLAGTRRSGGRSPAPWASATS